MDKNISYDILYDDPDLLNIVEDPHERNIINQLAEAIVRKLYRSRDRVLVGEISMNLTLERCLGYIEVASIPDRSAFLSEMSRKLLPYFTDEDLNF